MTPGGWPEHRVTHGQALEPPGEGQGGGGRGVVRLTHRLPDKQIDVAPHPGLG